MFVTGSGASTGLGADDGPVGEVGSVTGSTRLGLRLGLGWRLGMDLGLGRFEKQTDGP